MALKRRHSEEHENHERWLVSYADFITLLFAFFVIMYATSNNNEEKQKKFEESVREKLKLGMAGGNSSQNQAAGEGAEAFVPELRTPIEGFPRQGGPKEVEDYLERKLGESLSRSEAGAVSKVHHDFVGARISLAASSFFPLSSAKLKLSSLQTLDKVAEILKQTDKRVIVEGHTDDRPIVGGVLDSNWELASLRATSVVRYLIKFHHIDPKRLAAISYADQRPLVPNDSEENRAQNRRIEILIVTNEK